MATRQANPVLRHIRGLVGEGGLSRLTDRQLLERFTAQGDQAAFEAIVRRHGPMVLRVCRSALRDEHAAEDAFQATFLVLARKAGSLRRQELLAAWLYGVAHRVAARARVEAAKRLNREARAAARTAPDPVAELSTREVCAVLEEELGNLPEKYRAPFYLCHVEGRTRDQAARQLGCSLRTLQRLLGQGRWLLQARLSRRGVSLTAALLAATLTHGKAPAAVPAALLAATLSAARATTTGGAVPVKAAALAEGVLRRMPAPRVKLLAVLALVAASAGAALMAQSGAVPEGPPPAAKSADARAHQPRPATDRYGDPLPHGALFRLGSLRLRTGAPVHTLLFAPDGKGLFSGAFTETVRLWDTATGKQLRRFDLPPHQGAARPPIISALALSADGRTLAAGSSGGSVILWEAATGQRLRTLPGKRGRVHAVAFSPDGKLLAAAADLADQPGSIFLWDTRTGEELRRLKGHTKEVNVLAFAPGGRLLASGGADTTVRLWNAVTGAPLRVLRGHVDHVCAVAFSPDGKSLASSGWDNAVRFWEVATGQERSRPEQAPRPYSAVAFSPDGKLLAVGSTGEVFLWGADSTTRALARIDVKGGVRCLAFVAQGKGLLMATGYGDGTVRLWDLPDSATLLRARAGARLIGTPRHALGHQSGIYAVAVAPDGKIIATGGDDATVRFWDAATGKEVRRLDGHTHGVMGLCYSRDGKLLASAGGDGRILVREAATGKTLRRLEGRCVAFSPDGKLLATATADQKAVIKLWDLATGRELRRLHGHRAAIYHLAFSPDGKTLASCGMGIPIGLMIDGEEIEVNTMRLWDVASGKLRYQFGDPHEYVFTGVFSPDGKTFISGGDPRRETDPAPIRLWETATGKERTHLTHHRDRVWSLALSPGGRVLASGGSDGTARLWDLNGGKELCRLEGHRGWVTAVAFGQGGRTLVTGSWDTTALVWDVAALVGRGPLPKIDPVPGGR
jgi:RNA polymerase sigma factor (sigma-70 family)